MQQHRQLASRGNDGPFLSRLAAALGQLQPPSSQITISSKRTEYVVRSLHQQGSQIRIALFADVHLRFALPRVSTARLQSHVATCVAALVEAVRIFQRQHVGQGNQRTYALDLLQQRRLRVTLLRDGFDLLVVLGDALTQRPSTVACMIPVPFSS